jgi:L-asparaginase
MAEKPRICLIYTGGTIGMKTVDGELQPPDNPDDFLNVAPELDKIVDFEFVTLRDSEGKPINKDSTDMIPDDWVAMAKAVWDRRDEEFDGFVIAHGTDTMHFSASALAFAFGPNLNFPVVFTGAQTISTVAHGDARVNLVRACKLAAEDLAEVVICFDEYVFRGCRCQKKDEKRFDAFESPGYFPIGYISESIELTPLAKKRERFPGMMDYLPNYEKGVFVVSLVPGLEPELIYPVINQDKCKGLLLQSFGAGNVPNWKEFSFLPLIAKATDLGKPVVISSQFPGHSTLITRYVSGLRAHEVGGIPTGNMTSAAAVVKLRWALARVLERIEKGEIKPQQKVNEVRKIMQKPYVREMDLES